MQVGFTYTPMGCIMFLVILMRTNCATCKKNKHFNCEEKTNLVKRLNVIEGQVRGIKQMIIDDRYCDEVLVQLSAAMHSLKSIGNQILNNHMKTCMVEDIKEGKLEVIDDVIELFDKLNK